MQKQAQIQEYASRLEMDAKRCKGVFVLSLSFTVVTGHVAVDDTGHLAVGDLGHSAEGDPGHLAVDDPGHVAVGNTACRLARQHPTQHHRPCWDAD